VTVQLPIYKELHVVERLIDAVTRLDYPRDRLQLQARNMSKVKRSHLCWLRRWLGYPGQAALS